MLTYVCSIGVVVLTGFKWAVITCIWITNISNTSGVVLVTRVAIIRIEINSCNFIFIAKSPKRRNKTIKGDHSTSITMSDWPSSSITKDKEILQVIVLKREEIIFVL